MVKILRKEMNILFSCDEYPPLRTGGIGTATKTVAEGLVKKGHKVFVVSGWPYNHDLPYLSEVNGVTVFRIKYFNNLRKVLSIQKHSDVQADTNQLISIKCNI